MRWTPLARVAGRSMEPAFGDGAIVAARPPLGAAERDDVLLIRRPDAPRLLVKRVAATGGDTVEMEAGRLFVNREAYDGRPRLRGAGLQRWHVPAGHVFVVGDNAAASTDSRVWDRPFVAASEIVGMVSRRRAARGRPGR